MKSIVLLAMLSSVSAYAEFDETLIQAPLKESNEVELNGISCRTRNHNRWDICYDIDRNNNYNETSFKFQNNGVNRIVPMEGFGVGRDFEFQFQDMARSDLGLLVWDSPDEVESHAHLKMMYFFPRNILPAIRYESDAEKDLVIVTLPTEEEVVFNGKTKEIISGALTEGPIKQTSNGTAIAPDVQYNGKGVVVEAAAVADWPVGFEGDKASKIVSVKKKGQKTCLIPGKELWFTDHSKGGNVFFNKKLISNEAFDKFLKGRCGFGIY
nr:hypothetical protein BHI3_19830 [Bacteriovorax sp. HI3]